MEPCRPLGLLAIEDSGDDQHGHVEPFDRRGDGFVDVDRDVEQSDIERSSSPMSLMSPVRTSTRSRTPLAWRSSGPLAPPPVEVDPEHVGAESGCGDCENAAPGSEVDDAVSGPMCSASAVSIRRVVG